MSTLSKAEYLKKYISDGSSEKTKKRRKKAHNVAPTKKMVKSRIVDDDVDPSMTLPKEYVDPYANEDEPTVAEIVDERPQHIQELEKYRNDKWKQMNPQKMDTRNRHDSDDSRVKRTRCDSNSDSDYSHLQKNRHDSDSDESPVRRARYCDSDHLLNNCVSDVNMKRYSRTPILEKRVHTDSNSTHDKGRRNDFDSNLSPPRAQQKRRNDSDSDQSPERPNHKRQRNDSDSDQSPNRNDLSKQQTSDSDQSPQRNKPMRNKKLMNPDSDQSPIRTRRGSDSDLSPVRRGNNNESNHLSDKDSNIVKTSRGAKAGLSSAAEMHEEMKKLRSKEEKAFKAMDKSATGEHAATVIRDKSGKVVDMHAEMKKDREKREKDEKYAKWSKGLKQQEIQTAKADDAMHEMSKPLARYKDDSDLDAVLKEQDREGDPMLAFIKSKKVKTDKRGNQMPKYSGPPPPPNRFGIAPGYRWDGVDRYNGFEKRFFEQMNAKKAKSQAAFKWSTEDM